MTVAAETALRSGGRSFHLGEDAEGLIPGPDQQ